MAAAHSGAGRAAGAEPDPPCLTRAGEGRSAECDAAGVCAGVLRGEPMTHAPVYLQVIAFLAGYGFLLACAVIVASGGRRERRR